MSKRVLLVDDEPVILVALAMLVQMRGWTPLVAHTGAEALALVGSADVVVTDYCMPQMNGLELLRAIREGGRRTPVVLLTGHGSAGFAERAREAGAFTIVAKPFDVDRVALAIERALELTPAEPRP